MADDTPQGLVSQDQAPQVPQVESMYKSLSRALSLDILNVSMTDIVNDIRKRLDSFDATKTAYAVLFVGAIAFIAQGVYALITIGLAVIVAAWSLKKLFS